MPENTANQNGAGVILGVKNVSRTITKKNREFTTVRDITFDFRIGGIYNLVGASGAGKTSFLRLLNRLDEVTSGDIFYQNKSLKEYPPTELRVKIAMLFQEPFLFEGTVAENLKYCCPERDITNIEEHLSRVGLNGAFAEKDASDLSVGERQRVALARSLFRKPEIILLDEPTSALDPSSSRKIEQLILKLSHELSLMAIIVTHSPDQARRMGGETLLLAGGELVESGETSRLLDSPQTEIGQKYISNELS